MAHTPFTRDENKYINYYVSQAGGELPGFSGTRVQYGSGIAGIFRGLFRWGYPLLMKGLNIIKPHAKKAAGDVATALMKAAVERGHTAMRKSQDGNGLVVFTRKKSKRPPMGRSQQPKKRKRVSKSKKNNTL